MNKTKLLRLLKKAEASGITSSETPQNNSPPLKATYSANSIDVQGEIKDELLKTIKKIPELSIFDGKLFNCGSWAQRVEFEDFIEHLLRRTCKYGVQKTLDDLDKYINLDGNPLSEIQLVSGIELKKEISLTDNTKLVPFDKIPDCRQKDKFSPSSYSFPYNECCAKAAILRKAKALPKSWHQDDKSPKKLIETKVQLSNLCDILTLIGPSSPCPKAYWTILDEIVPMKETGVGFSGDISVPSPFCKVYKYKPQDYVFARNIVKNFLCLGDNLKNSLLLSLKRLNMAQRRNSMEDKAIDLGMSLEILLLHDYSQNDPIALPFRLRGAWFLGREMGGRKHAYDLLKAIYDCRCSAVHSGKLKKNKHKINGQGVQLKELFEQGFKLCAKLIIKIIKEKKFPDWETLILKL